MEILQIVSVFIIILLIVIGIYSYTNQGNKYEDKLVEERKKSEIENKNFQIEKLNLEADCKVKLEEKDKKYLSLSPLKEFHGKIYSLNDDNIIPKNILTLDEENNNFKILDITGLYEIGNDNDNLFFEYDSNSQLLKKSYINKCVEHVNDDIKLSECDNSLNQRWRLYRYKISPITDSNKCLKDDGKLGICDNTNNLKPILAHNPNKDSGEKMISYNENLYEFYL